MGCTHERLAKSSLPNYLLLFCVFTGLDDCFASLTALAPTPVKVMAFIKLLNICMCLAFYQYTAARGDPQADTKFPQQFMKKKKKNIMAI